MCVLARWLELAISREQIVKGIIAMKIQVLFLGIVSTILSACVSMSISSDRKSSNNAGSSARSKSMCRIKEVNDNIIVCVIIDAKAECIPHHCVAQQEKIEGTAMLRTWKCLRKAFPELGNETMSSRQLKNSFDDDTCCYYYYSSFKKSEILARIARKR